MSTPPCQKFSSFNFAKIHLTPKSEVRSDPETDKLKECFKIVGIIPSECFQKCKFIANKLYRSFPKIYKQPIIRPMLNVEWCEYISKERCRSGPGSKIWALRRPVAVFLDDEFVGDDDALLQYIETKFRLSLNQDWYCIGLTDLYHHLSNIMFCKYRTLIYLTIAIHRKIVGSLLFELYNDLVPITCENFKKRCCEEPDGFAKTPIQRIVKNSWIQCGGFDLTERQLPTENYIVPHDRRGVLGACNDFRHKNNSTQFYITLAPTPWMNYNYVAFGQLIQGAEILTKIEELATYREAPIPYVDIVKCGEFTFEMDEPSQLPEELHQFLKHPSELVDQIMHPDANSLLTESKYRLGLYCLATDLRNYLPFHHLSYYDIDTYLNKVTGEHETHYEKVVKKEENFEYFYFKTPPPSQTSLRSNYFDKYSKPNKGFIKRLMDSKTSF